MCCYVFCLLLFYFGVVCFAGQGDPIKKIGIPLPNSNSGNLLSTPVLFDAAIDRALRCQDLPNFGSV